MLGSETTMSRIGLQPVPVPQEVTADITREAVSVRGPKGILSVAIPRHIAVSLDGRTIRVSRNRENGSVKALHGTARKLIANAVYGVSTGFTKSLEVKGVGYRAALKGNDLILTVGFSQPVTFPKPEDVMFQVKGTTIMLSGIDKARVGEIAAQIRRIRPPDAYKGKGIRYVGEVVRLKPGKAAMKTAA